MPDTPETIVRRLSARRPGLAEANIQADVAALLRSADLDLDTDDLRLESPTEDNRRIDIQVGRTVIEIKRNLDRDELVRQGESQLRDYLGEREAFAGERYVGVLTDGQAWWLYRRSEDGSLRRIAGYINRGDERELVVWLEGALATKQDIAPTPDEIELRIGVHSTSFQLDFDNLLETYRSVSAAPEVLIKRRLWERLLRDALGMGFGQMGETDQEALFVRHTYLVAVAEVVAHLVIGVDVANADARHLMSGAVFRQQQIGGVVEADFFDWITDSEAGRRFVRTLARRLARFDFSHPEHDVLKVLYESVIDASTRHSLGEYYTPDWLAQRMIDEVIDDPLAQRILDPACGSGTFLFWAIRKVLAAGEAAGASVADSIEIATSRVVGIDLHPVAVTLARVTALLAIGNTRLQQRRPFRVQVYLGDSMMWRQPNDLLGAGGLTVFTSDGETLFADQLVFPDALLSDMDEFDRLLADLTEKASDRIPGSAHPSIAGLLRAHGVNDDDRPSVIAAYEILSRLHDERRDHIWGYYIRNLARPFYLSKEKVDRLVGNPPWLAYRFMDASLKERFKEGSKRRNLWVGGTQATHQDLAGYFVARSVERFLAIGGRFAFVMPSGTLAGRQYAGFRKGDWSARSEQVNHVNLAQYQPWRLVDVKPHPFPVPSCVVFGARTDQTYGGLPTVVSNWTARLPSRGNLDWGIVGPLVTREDRPVRIATDGGSPYRQDFTQGATLVPRMLLFVEDDPAAPPIGAGVGMRAVRSLRTAQEKSPWADLDSLHGNVERRFIRPVYLGESIVPYRLLRPLEAIIPWDDQTLLHGDHSDIDLYPGLASWWRRAEQLRASNAPDGMSINQRIDYRHGLSGQLPGLAQRVVYTKSGSRLAAAILSDSDGIIDHLLYWAPVGSMNEARYLCGILNSAVLLDEVQDYQPVGQFGPRHFDKYVFEPPYPRYSASKSTHVALAQEVEAAEVVTASVSIDGLQFQAARSKVRAALSDAGIGDRIDELVLDVLTSP